MKNKKLILFMLLASILVFVVVCLGSSLIYSNFKNNLNNKIKQEILEEKKYGFNGEKYFDLEEIPEEEIIIKFEAFKSYFKTENIERFDDNKISLYTAHEILMYKTATEKEVKQFVDETFGIEDFDLKEGIYKRTTPDSDHIYKIAIEKNEGIYSSDAGGFGTNAIDNDFRNSTIEFKNDQILMKYDYGSLDTKGNIIDKIGETTLYLEPYKDTLIIKKMLYTKINN